MWVNLMLHLLALWWTLLHVLLECLNVGRDDTSDRTLEIILLFLLLTCVVLRSGRGDIGPDKLVINSVWTDL